MVTPALEVLIRTRLLDGRERLSATNEFAPNDTNVKQLLDEVDAALNRLVTTGYGFCEICKERIEGRQLLMDPLRRYCFSHLPPGERVKILRDREFPNIVGVAPPASARRWRVVEAFRAAWKILRSGAGSLVVREFDESTLFSFLVETRRELDAFKRLSLPSGMDRELEAIKLLSVAEDSRNRDLEAVRLVIDAQRRLLPASDLCLEGWAFHFDYVPLGPVGGDYCDLVSQNSGELFLFIGDVMGKGYAASKISSQLNGVFRTLLDLKLPVEEMLERTNRIFCERVQVIGYYATLICIRAISTGFLELINAGHPPPLWLRSGGVERVESTGLPLGLFCASKYEVTRIQLMPGETLLFYTDGVTEARNSSDTEYGLDRLAGFVAGKNHLAPADLVRACRDDVSTFISGTPPSDDALLFALRRL